MNSLDEKTLTSRDALEIILRALLNEHAKSNADVVAISCEIREVVEAIRSTDASSKLHSELNFQERKLIQKEFELNQKELALSQKEINLEKREVNLGVYKLNLHKDTNTRKKSSIQRFLQGLRHELPTPESSLYPSFPKHQPLMGLWWVLLGSISLLLLQILVN